MANQQFHTASYRGNVQGHDNYLRADSVQPSSFQSQAGFASSSFSAPVASQYRGSQRAFQPTGYVQSVYGQGQQQQQQQFGASQLQSQESFHAANYKGNQPGHDNYLRADSQQPNNFQSQASQAGSFQNQATSFRNQASFQSQFQPQQAQFTSSVPQSSQFQNQVAQSQFQNPSAQQFHTANYQGNQPGHDNYLRADSQQPNNSQSQFGRSSF